MLKKYYLAYGCNLNLSLMKHRCPTAKKVGSIDIEGYRLVYKGSMKGYATLTLEECEGYTTPLGLYELSIFDIKALDIYEGYPDLYLRHDFKTTVNGKTISALLYIMKPEFDYQMPSNKYVEECIQGYADFGFDRQILDKALQDTINILSERTIKHK